MFEKSSTTVDRKSTGSLTVIAGSMFAGKTEELIRRVRRALYAGRRVQVFNHALHEAVAVSTSRELLDSIGPSTDLVAIEEVQFFDECIVDACNTLADRGYGVIASGLDMDFRREPFGPMPDLLAEADEVVKLRAICARCGRDASRSQRLVDGEPASAFAPTIFVGAQESYEARCRHCHEV